jgi:putative tricarboxylic transport membrane protein
MRGGDRVNEPQTHKSDPAGIVVAALLALAAAIIAWDAGRLELGQTYGLGPKAMPYVVAVGLTLLAIGNLVMALRGALPLRESTDPKAIIQILGGLAVLIAIIGFGGGFILATTVLFATTARAFGRRAFLVDLAIGFVLSFAIYLMFDKLLTLSLPAGPLERLL